MALDIIHSLIVDQPDGMVDRREVMEQVEFELYRPLAPEDSDEMREYVIDTLSTSSEAQASAAAWDELLPDDIPAHGPEA